MKKSTIGIGLVAVAVIATAALLLPNTDLFKGSMQGVTVTYKNASWKCYDGTSKNASSACKTSSVWSNEAKSYCKNKCKGSKCGVNSFSVSNKCPKQAAPADQQVAPAGQQAAPVGQQAAPAGQQAAPEGQQAAPAGQQAAPQLSWMERLAQLVFVDFQRTTDDAGNLVFTTDGGRFKVTQPDLEDRNNEEEYFAKFYLSQSKLCFNAIQEQIGREPYRGQIMASKVEINPAYGHSFSTCCDARTTDYAIWNIFQSNAEFETAVYSENVGWKSSFINYNICLSGHEELHRFLNGTNVPSWANEGLATRIEQRQSGSGSLIECLPDRFRALSAEGPGEVTLPFRNLSTDWSAPGIYSYYTAACFWDHVAKTYGEGKIPEIINALYAAAPLGQDSDFINNVLVPTLGEDIIEYLSRMGITSSDPAQQADVPASQGPTAQGR